MLSTTAQHALRAMVGLSRAPEGSSLRGRELSEESRVPSNYLAKILLDLKKSGLVQATRGTGGGYRLGRPPESIRLIEIVEIFDQSRAHPRCLLDFEHECSDETACTAHEHWKRVRDSYVVFLESTSLAAIATGGVDSESIRRE